MRGRARPEPLSVWRSSGFGARFGPVADVHAARLVVAEVGARADFQPVLDARRPDLEVVLLGLHEAHVAGRHEQHPIRQAQALEQRLGEAGDALEGRGESSGLLEEDHLDLVELVDAQDAAGAARRRRRPRAGNRASRRRSGWAARAASMISSRWMLVTGTSAVGHEVQVVARHDVHLVFLVRDLARAASRDRRVDDGRRPDLGHAVLAGVHVEEAVDQRALQRRPGAACRRGKPEPATLAPAREIEHAEPLGDLPVRLALPAAGVARRAARPSRGRSRLRLAADGHVRVGRVGDAEQQLVQLRLDRRQLASIASILMRRPTVEARLRSATSGPFGLAPARMASPMRFDAVLRSAFRRSPSLEQRAPARVGREGPVDDRRVFALVDGALADDVGLFAESLRADAHG